MKPISITVAVAGPFEIQAAQPYVLKTEEQRLPVVCGEPVMGVTAIIGEDPQSVPMLVDGQSLSQCDNDLLLECNTSTEEMWLATQEQAAATLEFDLGQERTLSCIQVWNYNDPVLSEVGLGKADIAVWTQAQGWTPVLKQVVFSPGEGTDDYDEPTVLPLQGVKAAKVRFTGMQERVAGEDLGLSEVLFYQQRTAQACKPYPASGAKVRGQSLQSLRWTSGLDAVKQNIYLGFDPTSMTPLKTTDHEGLCSATLWGCSPDQTYYWRVDTTAADGTVTEGETWSFETPLMVTHWPLDETEGTLAHESSELGLHGRYWGNAGWRPTEGKWGGALMLSGAGEYIDLPDAVGSGGGAKTLALWAYPMERSLWARFIEIGNGEHSDNLLFSRYRSNDGLIVEAHQGNVAGERIIAEDTLDLNTWQFLAMTIDDAGQIVMYKDGQQVAQGDGGMGLRNVVRAENYIGRSNYSADAYYRGMIDDVWIINAVLNPDQIKDLYDGKGYRPVSAESKEVPLPTLVMDMPMAQKVLATPTFETPVKSGSRLLILIVVVGIFIVFGSLMGRKKV